MHRHAAAFALAGGGSGVGAASAASALAAAAADHQRSNPSREELLGLHRALGIVASGGSGGGSSSSNLASLDIDTSHMLLSSEMDSGKSTGGSVGLTGVVGEGYRRMIARAVRSGTGDSAYSSGGGATLENGKTTHYGQLGSSSRRTTAVQPGTAPSALIPTPPRS